MEKKKKKIDYPRLMLIIEHPRFKEEMLKIDECEKDRIFCKHNREHLMDVARIGRILWNEKGKYKKTVELEHIYAASLLHDIGRGVQYTQGISHEKASVDIAKDVLMDCGYLEAERAVILEAIVSHRDKDDDKKSNLSAIITKADRLSRNCFFCQAKEECNWSDKRKNLYLRY